MEKKFIFDDKTAIVETEKGKVRGYFYDDMYIFKGIPTRRRRDSMHPNRQMPGMM